MQFKKQWETVRNSPLPGLSRDEEITAHVRRFLLALQEAKTPGEWEYMALAQIYEAWCDLYEKQRSWPFRTIAAKLKQEYGARSYLRRGDRVTIIYVPDEYEVELHRARPSVLHQ